MKINKNKRLYRSRSDQHIAGVCGGIADYLSVDPTIVRILWVALCFAGGPGIIIYFVLAFIIPEEPEFVQTSAQKIKNDETGDHVEAM